MKEARRKATIRKQWSKLGVTRDDLEDLINELNTKKKEINDYDALDYVIRKLKEQSK